MAEVTDPALLARLNAGSSLTPVTDPAVLARLNRGNGRALRATQANVAPPDQSIGDWLSQRARDTLDLVGETGSTAIKALSHVPVIGQAATLSHMLARPIVKSITGVDLPDDPSDAPTQLTTQAADALKLSKPSTPGQRLTSDIYKGALGAAAIPAGGGEAEASTLASKVVPKLVDVLSGGSAGAATGGLRESGAPEWAQVLGGLTFGILPGATLSAGKNLIGTVAEHVGDENAQIRARRRLQAAATDPQAAAAAIAQPRTVIANTEPTTAELAQDPGLAAFNRVQPGKTATDLQIRQNRNQQTRVQAVQSALAGNNPLDLRALAKDQQAANDAARQNLVNSRAADRQALETQHSVGLDAQHRANDNALTDAVEAVGPYIKPESTATDVARPAHDTGYSGAINATQADYNHPIMTARNPVKMPDNAIEDLHTGIFDAAIKRYGDAGGEPPAEVGKIISDLQDQIDNKTINTQTLTNVNRRLGEFSKRAVDNRSLNDAGYASDLRNIINNATDPYVPPDYLAQSQKARATRRTQGDVYEPSSLGGYGHLMGSGGDGRPNIPDTELAGRLVPTGPSGATLGQQMKTAIPGAAETIVRHQMRRVLEDGMNSGVTNIGRNTARNYKPILDQFTNVRDAVDAVHAEQVAGPQRIQELETARDVALKAHDADTQAALAAHDQAAGQFTGSPLGKMAPNTADPGAMISSMLQGKGTAEQMKVFTDQIKNDPAAMSSARQAMADHIANLTSKTDQFDANGELIPKGRQRVNAIDEVLNRGGALLDDNQREVLTKVREELAQQNFADTQGKALESSRARLTLPVHTIANRTIHLLTDHFNNDEAVDKAIKGALLNPATAHEMLLRPTPDRMRNLRSTLRRSARGATIGTYINTGPPIQPGQ